MLVSSGLDPQQAVPSSPVAGMIGTLAGQSRHQAQGVYQLLLELGQVVVALLPERGRWVIFETHPGTSSSSTTRRWQTAAIAAIVNHVLRQRTCGLSASNTRRASARQIAAGRNAEADLLVCGLWVAQESKRM
jgi:hypothetical protein